MKKEIEIQSPGGIKTINQNELFIIAEVGNQFNGDVDTAKELCRVAHEAGADAVKFIFWYPDEILADGELVYGYEVDHPSKGKMLKTEPMFDLLDRLRLSMHDWASVKLFCNKLGIIMMTTITSPSSFYDAMELGLPALKLSSWSHNFPDMWQWCATSMLPCIVDLGTVNTKELSRNVNIFVGERNKNLIPMYCFHTNDYSQMNMSAIPYIADKFDCLVGYSSTDYNDETDIMAVALGACVIEKRLTLDRKGGVLHDILGKEPDEFKNYVRLMRGVKGAVGKYTLIPSDADLEARKKWFRRIVADCNISKGEIITRVMLEAKRGETGISPEFIWDYVGKKATRDIARNETIQAEDAS